ncbi:predicted protein [Naegleria gruberi]|uniref:Predicted protein n=1 Tax=Naegleria gruberi TaxID=5762 RepID=D2V6G6_NAEGR|nr:uncharacterized protein NAEGRDRAFT_64428 [Naegleria gruberi]EFC47443.1 predicted protein [Naegleria gruberi]|eukprot:XP_002680187.1 predicted protein [Naegleria gruberi strain NEG-M]
MVETCDVGRKAEVGTLLYESVPVSSANLLLFDSAGKPFENPDDLNTLKLILQGIKTGTNLVENYLTNKIDLDNRIDGVIFVCRACEWNSVSLQKFVKFQNVVKETDIKGLPFNPMIVLTHFTESMSEKQFVDKVTNAVPFAFLDNPKDLSKDLTPQAMEACKRISRQFKICK